MNDAHRFISRKAFEVGYGICRIATLIKPKSSDFASSLEKEAFSLVASGSRGDFEETSRSLQAIEGLLRLGGEVSLLVSHNIQIFHSEIASLLDFISELDSPAILPDSDLSSIFKTAPLDAPKEKGVQEETLSNINSSIDSSREDVVSEESLSEYLEKEESPARFESPANIAGFGVVYGGQVRQSMILDRIRKSENCKIKDIQEFLPNISERTLRYDLQKLSERGLIEKVGTGGPATYYQAIRA